MEVTVKNIDETGKTHCVFLDKTDLKLSRVRRIMVDNELEIPEFHFVTKNGNILSKKQEGMFTVDQLYKGTHILIKPDDITGACQEAGSHIPTAEKTMVVFVKTHTGRTITLKNIKDSSRISDLKTHIQHQVDIPPDQQRLIHGKNNHLADHQTCAECGIKEHSTVYLVLILRGS